jgi:hypothetical protein
MIHSYSDSNFGKGNEIVPRVNHINQWFEKLARDIYGGFLSESEIKDILEGKDIWLDSDEVLKRLQKKNQLLNRSKNKENLQEIKLTELKKKKTISKKTQNKNKS